MQSSTKLASGYIFKSGIVEDPSTPPKVCCFFKNLDMVRYILLKCGLAPRDRGACAKVCREFRAVLHSKERYFKAEFMARYRIFKGGFEINLSKDLLERLQKFVDDPNTDYSKFLIPREHSIITSLATRLLRKQKETRDTILGECQKALYCLHPNPNFHYMCDRYIPIPDFDKSNEYEMQAYHNTLYPVTKLIFDKTRDMWKKLPDSNSFGKYPLPTYLCIADVVLRESPRPHQVIDCLIEGATCPDDLKRMNNSLFHAKHTEMLTISMTTMSAIIDNVPINQFDWNAGEGIAALKSGLTRAPHLKILAFRDLLKPFDERNILAIADIIIARQKTKNMKPFTEIRFAERTLSQDVAVKFMEALKDYPVPLVVFLSPRDNNFIMNGDEDYDGMEVPFSTPQMKQFNKKLQLRWGDNYSGNMKLDASWGVNEYAVMHTWTKELEIIKSLSQRPKQE